MFFVAFVKRILLMFKLQIVHIDLIEEMGVHLKIFLGTAWNAEHIKSVCSYLSWTLRGITTSML